MAVVVYFWLRAVAGNRRTPALQRAKSHSFWCALIAFFASTSGQGGEFWKTTADGFDVDAAGIWIAALGPSLWMGSVYLIGLYSWPRELQSIRSASLEPRSLSTPMPSYLLGTAVAIALAACACLFMVFSQPGTAWTPSMEVATPQYTETLTAAPGTLAGPAAAGYFAAAIGSIVLCCLLVCLVILRRPPLAGLSHHDNQALRSVWLNRVLRMSTYLMAALIAGMVQYIQANTVGSAAEGNTPPAFGIAFFALAILLVAWGPKVRFEAEGQAVYPAFGRAREFLFTVGFIATTAVVLLLGIASTGWGGTSIGENASQVYLALASAVIAYLAITSGFAFYTHLRAGKSRALPRRSRRLPVYAYAVAGAVNAWGLYLTAFPPIPAPRGTAVMAVAATILAALAAAWWARKCAVPWKIGETEEIWYRQVMELRILRTASATLLAMPVWAYELGPIPLGASLVVFCIPAMVVLEQPKASLPQRQEA